MSGQAGAIRLFLLVEAACFGLAALIHNGLLLDGYRHQQAGVAESVIAAALVAGLALTAQNVSATRMTGLLVQGFALLGTLVGIFTIAVGVGPRTALDIAYHIGIVAVLVAGLIIAGGTRPAPGTS